MNKILSVVMIILFCFTACAGFATADQQKVDRKFNISFSPDGKKLLFNRDKSDQSYTIQTYNMETGELIAYRSPIGERWVYPRYSFDGKYIAFVTFPLEIIHIKELFHSKEGSIIVPDKSQIAVMDEDGKNVRKITNTNGYKMYPSFSHSGKKVIFARSVIMEKRPQRGIKWAVHEVNLETGKETCLTEFKFMLMSRPYYFPDDKTFIFWGDYLTLASGMSDDRSHEDFLKVEKIRKELESKYKDNSIYVMQANEKELKPYLVTHDNEKTTNRYFVSTEYSRHPSLSADGSVLIFMARGYKPDGSADGDHLYQYSADGNHRSITRIPSTETEEAVSPDGKQIAFITTYPYKIVIYQVKDGTSREITLPDQPSRIINSQ